VAVGAKAAVPAEMVGMEGPAKNNRETIVSAMSLRHAGVGESVCG
jgi:hypothetical protein